MVEEEFFRIHGGHPLKGTLEVSGSKNATLPILAASLLVDGVVILENVPNISDVAIMGQLLEALGVKIEKRHGGHTWHITVPSTLKTSSLVGIPGISEKASSIRGSLFLLGALLARTGEVELPAPGGCKIGKRPIDLHLMGLKRLGFRIEERVDAVIEGSRSRVDNNRHTHVWIYLDFPSVGATENILIAASTLPGVTTIIENAAAEPQVIALAGFLKALGVNIWGVGTRHLVVRGVRLPVVKTVRWRIFGDTLEAGTFAIYAVAMPGSELTIEGAPVRFLRPLIARLEETGAGVKILGATSLHVKAVDVPKPVHKISTLPYPGFPTDLQPIMSVYLTRAHGASKIYEFVYEKRFLYIEELEKMIEKRGEAPCIERILVEVSGKGEYTSPRENVRAIKINGPCKLMGAEVVAKNLRAGAALILAGLMADGETIVKGVEHVKRGYENIVLKLQSLGAEIEEISRHG